MAARIFDRNMFIMMLSIMAGFIIITYFVADIMHNMQIEQLTSEHTSEIELIEENNIYFTTSFLESSVLLDSAREDRAFGNYHFDIARLFYTSALSETNESVMEEYKVLCDSNCSEALPKYHTAHLNFELATSFFDNTKKYTEYQSYLTLLSMYMNLSSSGARLTLLRYNATKYLKMLSENITFSDNGAVLENMTALLDMFNETLAAYAMESGNYQDIQDLIDEYDIEGFSTIREPPS